MGMNEFQIMTSNFYPEQKARIQESWKRLFGHQQAIEAGDNSGVHSVPDMDCMVFYRVASQLRSLHS